MNKLVHNSATNAFTLFPQGLLPEPGITYAEYIRCAKLPNNNVSILYEATNPLLHFSITQS